MRASVKKDMEEIFESYEWLIREKLEDLDLLARRMFSEMGIFSVSRNESLPFVQEKMRTLILEVEKKGNEFVGSDGRFRSSKKEHSRPYDHIQAIRETSYVICGMVCEKV